MPDPELSRPLEKTTDTHWESQIIIQSFEGGGQTTALHWILRSNTRIGAIGGDVLVMPDRDAIGFRVRRDGEFDFYQDPEVILRLLVPYGWGEPPHFDAVCGSLKKFEEGASLKQIVEEWQGLEGIVDQRHPPGVSLN